MGKDLRAVRFLPSADMGGALGVAPGAAGSAAARATKMACVDRTLSVAFGEAERARAWIVLERFCVLMLERRRSFGCVVCGATKAR